MILFEKMPNDKNSIDSASNSESQIMVREIIRWLRQGPVGCVREKNGSRIDDPNIPNVALDNIASMIEKRWLDE